MKFNPPTTDAGINRPHKQYIATDPKYIYTAADTGYHQKKSYLDTDSPVTGDGFEQLITQRQNLIFSNLQMLYTEIYKRHQIKETNIYRINIDQCAFKNLIFQVNDYIWDKNRIELEQKIIDLEQEKRKQEANCFKDTLFIQQELRQSLIEKLDEQQKASFFMQQPEELSCTA